MKSRNAWFAMRSPLIRQLPRRSSESQPYTADTFAHFAIACATTASMDRDLCRAERIDRMRLVDAEALCIPHAHRLQSQEHVLVFDALGNDAVAERLPGANHRRELVSRRVARQHLAANAAVGLDELRRQLPHRQERHRPVAEAVDQKLAAERPIGIAEPLARAEAHEGVALVDLEQQLFRRYVVQAQLRSDEAYEIFLVERLAGKIHGEASNARAFGNPLHG